MNDEQRFLEAIRASPADDAPRLVFADWLLERRDPRGDLLIAQCARSRLEDAGDRTSDAYRQTVVAESRALTPARKRWFELLEITDKLRSGFERGLPYVLSVRPEHLAAVSPRIAELPLGAVSTPVPRSLRVDDLRALVAPLAGVALEEIELQLESAILGFDPTSLRAALGERRPSGDALVIVDGKVAPLELGECCVEIWHGADSRGDALLRIEPGDRIPGAVEVFSISARHSGIRAVLDAFGPERRSLKRLALAFTHPESFAPLLREWMFEGLEALELTTIADPSGHDTPAFAANHVAKGITSFETSLPFDDHLAAGLAEARLGRLYAHGGGSVTALERVLEHPIHTLSLRGFPSAELVDLICAKAPPTLSQLTFSELAVSDVPHLACPRLARLTRLWIQFTPNDAPELLVAPDLGEVPWIHCGRTNRYPIAGASGNPYAFRRPRM